MILDNCTEAELKVPETKQLIWGGENVAKDIKFFMSSKPYFKPFGFEELKEIAFKDFNYEFKEPQNIVMVGNEITHDVLFANKNLMTSVWVNKFKNFNNFTSESFKQLYAADKKVETDQKILKEDDEYIAKLINLEKQTAIKFYKDEPQIRTGIMEDLQNKWVTEHVEPIN